MNQTRLIHYGMDADVDLSVLTEKELQAYVSVRLNGRGVRQHARETGRAPGTIGNLLRRAECKMGERRE